MELIGTGIYSIPEAARLTGIPVSNIRRWTQGYEYVRAGQRRELPPVVRPQIDPIDEEEALSFRDLQELRFLQAFRNQGVSWHTLRLANLNAQKILDDDHPFSTGRFRSLGNAIMMETAKKARDAALLDVARNQFVFRRAVAPYLKGLVFDRRKDEPVRWFPTDTRLIVIDPARRFGKPIVTREGVPTRILAKAYNAEKSIEAVAKWYELSARSVRAAVAYENRLAA